MKYIGFSICQFTLYLTSFANIDSVKVMPQLIYATDTVTFIDFVTLPGSYYPQKDSIQIQGNLNTLHCSYYMGGFPAYTSGSDTFTLGKFAPGVYKISFIGDIYSNHILMQSDTAEIFFTVIGFTEIDEKETDKLISLYPNPTTNQLTITTPNFPIQTISIYNLQGQLIQQMKYTPQVDVSMLSAGMYVLEVQGQSGVVRRKFVKE